MEIKLEQAIGKTIASVTESDSKVVVILSDGSTVLHRKRPLSEVTNKIAAAEYSLNYHLAAPFAGAHSGVTILMLAIDDGSGTPTPTPTPPTPTPPTPTPTNGGTFSAMTLPPAPASLTTNTITLVYSGPANTTTSTLFTYDYTTANPSIVLSTSTPKQTSVPKTVTFNAQGQYTETLEINVGRIDTAETINVTVTAFGSVRSGTLNIAPGYKLNTPIYTSLAHENETVGITFSADGPANGSTISTFNFSHVRPDLINSSPSSDPQHTFSFDSNGRWTETFNVNVGTLDGVASGTTLSLFFNILGRDITLPLAIHTAV